MCMDDVMNYKGLASYLKMAQGTLRHWVMNGKVPFIKMGRNVRFSKKQIDAWLEKQSRDMRKKVDGDCAAVKSEGTAGELFAANDGGNE